MAARTLLLLLGLSWLVQAQDAQTLVFDARMAEHLLNRAGFGGTPAECRELAAMGLENAVDHILSAGRLPEARALPVFEPAVLGRPDRRELLRMDQEERRAAVRQWRRRDGRQLADYASWWLERMVATPAPLEEKMVLFWHGYFTSSQRDVRNSYHMILQNELFREHGLGSFRLLLHEVARDPAMLEYLDNNKNRKGRPNENFAREVMELFTLGTGNYTEEDIKEAARAFTGWTFRGQRFVFDRREHDGGSKTVLGKKGRLDGTDVLDILLAQEAAPRHVAERLLEYFLGMDPPAEMVARYGRLLKRHDWELTPVLRALFTDPAFYGPEVVGGRILGPVELVVGICRRLSERPPGSLLATACGQLGQTLFDPPNVKGWEGGAAWITTSTFLARGNFAGYLVEGIEPRQVLSDFAPKDRTEGADEMMMEPGDPARRPMAGMARELRGLLRARWRPVQRLSRLVDEARTVEEVVDILCDRLLAVPVTPEAKESLLLYLREKVEADSVGVYERPGEHRLRRLARLILSLPEAQIG